VKKLIIIGGGASGFFLASNIHHSKWKTILLEQAKKPLQKLKISGGGRCNITHACFSPNKLVKYYPRGSKELVSVFNYFQPSDTFEWFLQKGVNLKIENDNRVFPESNSSQAIIDTFIQQTKKENVKIYYNSTVINIKKINKKFEVITTDSSYYADTLVIATGSSMKMWKILNQLGHTIISPVPSLFTFMCNDPLLHNLQGISFPEAEIHIPSIKIKEFGPLLITHWGLSGPAILKLSAWSARELYKMNYRFILRVNWISETFDNAREEIMREQEKHPKKSVYTLKIYNLTQRFWNNLLGNLNVHNKNLADLSKKDINKIAESLTNTQLQISGKNTHKDEFVTAGGVDLKEVDFRTMQSKLIPNLFFAGEVLNIDALTGGFNFQACWSEAYIISQLLNSI
jgi:predicted Rossmann fold flavoprotein